MSRDTGFAWSFRRYNDITDDDYQVYWAGVSEDCRIFVEQGKDDTFMTVTLYLLQKDDSDAVN